VKTYTFALLQKAHNLEEVISTRIAGRAEHAHQALWRNVRVLGKLSETDRSVDVVAEDGFGRGGISREHAFDAFAEKFFTKLWIANGAGADCIFEIAGKGHAVLLLSQFVILPRGYGGVYISLLALFTASSKQNNETLAILAEIDTVAGAEVDPVFKYARTVATLAAACAFRALNHSA
jgi:hypothetical protein